MVRSSSPIDMNAITFDDLLASVGGYGRYQVKSAIMLFGSGMITGCVVLINVFSMAVPQFRCSVPNCNDNHYVTTAPFLSFSLPKTESGDVDSCHTYSPINASTSSCSALDFNQSSITTCKQYLFSTEYYESSAVEDFELVCENAWQVSLAQTVFFLGTIVASPITGQLATWIGRKPVVLSGLLVMAMAGIVLTFVNSYTWFLILQVPLSIGQTAVFTNSVLMGVEMVEKDRSAVASTLQQLAFTFGQLALVTLAFLFREWRETQLAIALPIALWFLLCLWLDESPRWLVTNGRTARASRVLRRMAEVNKQVPPHNLDEKLEYLAALELKEELELTSNSSESILDAFKSPIMTLRLLILYVVWLVVSLAFYGLSLNTASLGTDPYLTFALTALIEIPAYILSILAMDKFGRRLTVGLSLIIGAVFILGSCLQLKQFLTVVVFVSGKLFVTCAFGSIYLHTNELLPTSIRAIALGTCNMMGRIGATIAPSIGLAASILPSLPLLIMASVTFVAGLLVLLLLPDTNGLVLPDTIKEAILIGKKANRRSESDPLLNDGD